LEKSKERARAESEDRANRRPASRLVYSLPPLQVAQTHPPTRSEHPPKRLPTLSSHLNRFVSPPPPRNLPLFKSDGTPRPLPSVRLQWSQTSSLPRSHIRSALFRFKSFLSRFPRLLVRFRSLSFTGRLDQFESKISEVLFEHRVDDQEHVQMELWSSPGKEKVSSLSSLSLNQF